MHWFELFICIKVHLYFGNTAATNADFRYALLVRYTNTKWSLHHSRLCVNSGWWVTTCSAKQHKYSFDFAGRRQVTFGRVNQWQSSSSGLATKYYRGHSHMTSTNVLVWPRPNSKRHKVKVWPSHVNSSPLAVGYISHFSHNNRHLKPRPR